MNNKITKIPENFVCSLDTISNINYIWFFYFYFTNKSMVVVDVNVDVEVLEEEAKFKRKYKNIFHLKKEKILIKIVLWF